MSIACGNTFASPAPTPAAACALPLIVTRGCGRHDGKTHETANELRQYRKTPDNGDNASNSDRISGRDQRLAVEVALATRPCLHLWKVHVNISSATFSFSQPVCSPTATRPRSKSLPAEEADIMPATTPAAMAQPQNSSLRQTWE